MTVLVVDDDYLLLRAMRRQLGTMGVRCEAASDPTHALQMVATLQPEVLVCDFAMPDMDGLTLLRRSGDVSPGTVRVLMTAYSDERLLERAVNEAHAEFFLPKPFTDNQLQDVLTSALQRGDATRQGEAQLATASAERMQLEIIARALREMLVSKSLERALSIILDGVIHATGSRGGIIGEVTAGAEAGVSLRVLARNPIPSGQRVHSDNALGVAEVDGLVQRAWETGTAVIVDAGSQRPGLPGQRKRSLAALPFIDRGEVVGIVVVQGRKSGYPSLQGMLEPLLQTGTTLIQSEAVERRHRGAEQESAHERLQLRTSFDAALDGLVIVDGRGKIRQVNPSLCAMFGYQAHELLGARMDILMPVEQRKPYLDRLDESFSAPGKSIVNAQDRTVGLRKGGREFPIELSLVLMDDPVRGHSFAGTVRDLTEIVRQEHALQAAHDELAAANGQLQQLARTDGLTALANRRCFDETLESELHRARRMGTRFALVLCDIDHFKELNDQLGHQAGDGYLRQLARALAGSFRRSGEMVARWGGEEFALLVPHMPSPATAEQLGARLLRTVRRANLSRPLCSTGDRLTVSVGVAWCEAGAATADELLHAADAALYDAKQGGRDRSVEVQVGVARKTRLLSL